jgi:hypothetical protein
VSGAVTIAWPQPLLPNLYGHLPRAIAHARFHRLAPEPLFNKAGTLALNLTIHLPSLS